MNLITNNISVYKYGKSSCKPIVFIHGFPFDNKMWKKQTNYFSNEYYCISYDVRGLGNSSAGNGQFTMELFVDDLFDIIEQLRIEKPVVCGLSMGGYIALRAVERDMNKFSGLILCDSKSEADDNPGKLKRAGAIKNIVSNGLEDFVPGFIKNCVSEKFLMENPKEFSELVSNSSSFSPIGVIGSLLAMLSRTDTTEFLPNINIPSLIICGEFDKLTPPDVMESIHKKIQGSEFVVVPEAAHLSTVENPEYVNQAIKTFLKKINY